jgi:signal peptidase II
MSVETQPGKSLSVFSGATTTAGKVGFAVAFLTLALDQLSKFAVLRILELPARGTVRLLPIFSLTMVWNPGVSFGLLKSEGLIGRLALAGFAFAVVVGLAFWTRKAVGFVTAIGLGLVMGGAVGNNLVDRLRFGRVADIIDVSGLGFFPWVFNVADSAIAVGVALLLYDSLRRPAPRS